MSEIDYKALFGQLAANHQPTSIDPRKVAEARQSPDKARRKLCQRWRKQFEKISKTDPADYDAYSLGSVWRAFFDASDDYVLTTVTQNESDDDEGETETSVYEEEVYLTLRLDAPCLESDGIGWSVSYEKIDEALNDPAFWAFYRFSMSVKNALDAIGDPLADLLNPDPDVPQPRGWKTEDEIEAPAGGTRYVVPNVLPYGLTNFYGLPSGGKSSWMLKLMRCVAADDDVKFEGIDIEHGSCVYVTLDNNATIEDVKQRLIEIRDRLHLPPTKRIRLTDDRLYLDEPTSVDQFLANRTRGERLKLLVIDPLYKAATRDAGQVATYLAMSEAVGRLLREIADAVVIIDHTAKDGDSPYGTIFKLADTGGTIYCERPDDKKPPVTITVQRIKNGRPRSEPFRYKMELNTGYLDLQTKASASTETAASAEPSALKPAVRRAAIWARLPDDGKYHDSGEVFPLISDLVTGKQMWAGDREAMEEAAQIKTTGTGNTLKVKRLQV